jgi:D-sedoheptulose 7-phosphate isomerase
MNRIEQLYREQPGATGFARGYLDYLKELFAKLDTDEIAAFIEVLLQARARGARIFFIGNGGSAATASHFANDIAIGTRSWSRPFRAISLTDNVPVLTAIGNDYGYAEIFTSQLKALMVRGDVVVAISASGNSPNIVQAVEYANQQGAITVGLSGFDGGSLKQFAQYCVHVPTDKGEYGPVEDIHLILDHLVGSFLICECRAENSQ